MIEPISAPKFIGSIRIKAIASLLVIAIALSTFVAAGVLTAYSVSIKADGETMELTTTEQTVSAVLDAAGIEVGVNDAVDSSEFEVGKNSDEGNRITVYRAANVTIKENDKTVMDLVVAGTVKDAIEQSGVIVDERDTVNYDSDVELTDGMTIEIFHGFPVEVKADGKTQKIYTYEGRVKDVLDNAEITLEKADSVEPSLETPLEEGMTIKVKRGTENKSVVPGNTKGAPSEYVAVIRGSSTAYSARPGALTASGVPAARGRVAVNPKQIPYGSQLYIVSDDGRVYGYAVAADTGGFARQGSAVVDLYMDTNAECCQWGRRNVTIYVISWGNGRV